MLNTLWHLLKFLMVIVGYFLTVAVCAFFFLIGYKNGWWDINTFYHLFDSILRAIAFPYIPEEWRLAAEKASLPYLFAAAVFIFPSFIFLLVLLETWSDKKRSN